MQKIAIGHGIQMKIRHMCFAPFCQELLIDVPEKIKTLDVALNYLTKHYGASILEDKQTVLRFVETFLPGKKRERNFLNMAYAGGLVKSVLVTVNDSTEKQRIFVHQAIDQMQENYGISEEWANYIMNSVASSLGIDSINPNSGISKKTRGGKWRFRCPVFFSIGIF